MRKFKIILSVMIICLMATIGIIEVYAATYINFNVSGNIEHYATELGAKLWGGYALGNADGTSIDYANGAAVTFSQGTEAVAGNGTGSVYTVKGDANEFSNIAADAGSIAAGTKTVYMFYFVRNDGSRNLMPQAMLSIDQTKFTVSSEAVVFDTDLATSIDPYAIKNDATSMTYLQTVYQNISKGTAFTANTSVAQNDVFLQVFKLTPIETIGATTGFNVSISFFADISYEEDNILTVYQPVNSSSSAWTKYGANANLAAAPYQKGTDTLDAYYNILTNADANGNVAGAGGDDYLKAVVFKDIDLVNIDVATGEPVGRLSDTNYDFEWYGGRVTLPSGTVLASGRTLNGSETFDVDVYTYYPEFYIRRWVVGGNQYISVSDEDFPGAVHIKETYVATFESTLFQPKFDESGNLCYYYTDSNGLAVKENDAVVYGTTATKTIGGTTYAGEIVYEIASNSNGIFARSYVYDYSPLSSGSVSHQINNYLFENNSAFSATASTTQSQMLAWATNLTKAWETNLANNPSKYSNALANALPMALSAQGESNSAYIYNLLYLVKYADNGSQEKVGQGNVNTYSKYNVSGTTAETPINSSLVIGNGNGGALVYYEAQKGGSVIGVSSSNTADDAYRTNTAGMVYGYAYKNYQDASSNNSIGKRGLYAHQFLTYTDTSTGKRHLLDGYIGTNGYTSVFCLGQANPWGNVWKWVFGSLASGTQDGDGNISIHLFTTFEEYDYKESNWYLSSSFASESTLSSGNYNYSKMSYNLPLSNGDYNYLGTSQITSGNGLQSLVGLPTSESSTSSGLKDYYYVTTNSNYLITTYGVLRGGYTHNGSLAGAFFFHINYTPTITSTIVGFRLSLNS